MMTKRAHDLRYNFSGYESSSTLKTYLKMNTDPNSEASFISYKNSDETFDSTFEGTIKDDSTLMQSLLQIHLSMKKIFFSEY